MLSQRSLNRLRQIPEPEDYFSGASGRYSIPPREILLFTRNSVPEAMGQGVAMHSRFVLCVCIETGGTIMVEGHLFPLEPGQGLLLYPFQQHSFSHFADEKVFWLFVSFDLSEKDLPSLMRGVPFSFSRRDRVYLNRMVDSFASYQRGDVSRACSISAWLSLLLDERLRVVEGLGSPIEGKVAFDPRLRTVVRYIYEHLEQDLDVADLARETHLSASHLRKVFREAMGVSLGHFMLTARLNHAAALLHETRLSVSEIAETSGFESVYTFSRAFKRDAGEAPSAFRTRVQKIAL